MCLQEEREAAEKEREEVDKLRTMGEEERRIELRNNPKVGHAIYFSSCKSSVVIISLLQTFLHFT